MNRKSKRDYYESCKIRELELIYSNMGNESDVNDYTLLITLFTAVMSAFVGKLTSKMGILITLFFILIVIFLGVGLIRVFEKIRSRDKALVLEILHKKYEDDKNIK